VINDGKCLGLIDIRSIVEFLVNLFYQRAKIGKDDPHEVKLDKLSKQIFSLEDIVSITQRFDLQSVKDLINIPFKGRTLDLPLKDVIRDLAVHERVPIVNEEGKIVSIISQAVIVKFLVKSIDKLGPRAFASISELDIISKPVQTVSEETPTILAFAKMFENNFSALAIVDSEDSQMLGVISFKDFKGSLNDFSKLFVTTEDYIKSVRMEDFRDMIPTVNIKSSSSLAKAISKLNAVGIHRLFTYDENDKPHHFSGVVTLNDVLKVLVR